MSKSAELLLRWQRAINNSETTSIAQLLKEHPEFANQTPLHIAASWQDPLLVERLLNAGADKTLLNGLGDTACCWSVRCLAPDQVTKLLDFEENRRRNPQLWNAAHAGDLDEVKKLIEQDADPNSYNESGAGPLLNFHANVTEYLLEQGADPDLQRNESVLPVLVGIAGFNTECLKLMLGRGADPNIASHLNGETALYHAVCGNHIEQVHALLNAGADPNKRTFAGRKTYCFWRDVRVRGETALHRAAAYAPIDVVERLLKHDANPNLRDSNNDSPLSWASWHMRDRSVIDLLNIE